MDAFAALSLADAPADAVIARLRAALDHPESGAAPATRSDYDLNGAGPGATAKALRPAAVLAPLIARPDGLKLIFTVRAAELTKHAGQISFPGGRVDPGDASLGAAALREAEEEIGMAPGQVELLGAFDAYETVTGFEVTPFVGLVDPAFSPVPDPREVEEVFEAPFAFFMDAANHKRAWREWNGEKRYFYEMPFEDRYVWGATAGMLKALHDRLNQDGAG